MRKMTISQTTTAAWSADSVISTDLERVGLITRIDFTVEITPSATLTAAHQPDAMFRLINNLRIIGGSHTYMTLPSDDNAGAGALHHYLSQQDGFGYGHASGAVADPITAYTAMNWPFHCGSRPRLWGYDNPFDLSAFIPAHGESQLRAEWTVSGNDVMDDTVTIASAVGVFTIHRVMGTEAEIMAEMARQMVVLPNGAVGMIPAWASVVHANAGTTTDFDAETINIPVGAFLKRIAMLVQDAVATRANRAQDSLTEFSINSPTTNERLYQARAEYQYSLPNLGSMLVADTGGTQAVNEGATASFTIVEGADFGGHAAGGIHVFDARPRTNTPIGSDYGWDLRTLQTGDLTIGLLLTTRTGGDDTLVLFERYAVYQGSLV